MSTEYHNHLIALSDFFKSIGKKQNDIARELSIAQPYISSLINGKRTIGRKMSARLAELYGLSYTWLLTGEGNMIQDSSHLLQQQNNISMGQLERINQAVDYLKFKKVFKTQKELAVMIGKQAPNVSEALKGGKYFSDSFILCFADRFKDIISTDWLLTGEGDMLAKQPIANAQHTEGNNNTNVIGDNNNVANNVTITRAHAHANNNIIEVHEDTKPIVPKYLASKPNTDVYQVIKQGQVANLTTLKTIPPYQDFDFYYQVRQDAMQPLYMQGDVLALVHVSDGSDIVQGAAMVVDTKDYGFMLRRLYDRGDCYECKRINEQSAFENQKVAKDKVIRLYRVVYSVRLGD